MAKKTKKEFVISEEWRPFIELLSNGKVKLSFLMDRIHTFKLKNSVERELDLAQAGGPAVLAEFMRYGIQKKIKDSAGSKDKLSDADYLKQVIENCEKRLQWAYGEIEMNQKTSISTEGSELRSMFIKWILKNLRDSENNKFTKKSLPSVLVKARTVDNVILAAKELGIPQKVIDLNVGDAQAIEAIRQRNAAIRIDLDDLDSISSPAD